MNIALVDSMMNESYRHTDTKKSAHAYSPYSHEDVDDVVYRGRTNLEKEQKALNGEERKWTNAENWTERKGEELNHEIRNLGAAERGETKIDTKEERKMTKEGEAETVTYKIKREEGTETDTSEKREIHREEKRETYKEKKAAFTGIFGSCDEIDVAATAGASEQRNEAGVEHERGAGKAAGASG